MSDDNGGGVSSNGGKCSLMIGDSGGCWVPTILAVVAGVKVRMGKE